MNSYISFNPIYRLKPDEGKALLLPTRPGRILPDGSQQDSFTHIIHPIFAMILTFFDGRNMEDCVKDASEFLEVPQSYVGNLINKLIDNSHKVRVESMGTVSIFPPHTLISHHEYINKKSYDPSLFEYEKLNMTMSRHKTPTTITLMLNNVCVTDCVYCYQDKRRVHQCEITLDRIIGMIQEAKELHVSNFDVIGGEFFLYPHWYEVLKALREAGYNPFVSTKMPLDKQTIDKLVGLSLSDLQVSLDTLIPSHLITSLKVKDSYIPRIKQTLQYLSERGIPVIIHSVLTRYNDSIEDMKSIFDFISTLKNIAHWKIVKGDPSLYPKLPYNQIEISSEKLNSVIDYLTQLRQESKMAILVPEKELNVNQEQVSKDRKFEKFFGRSLCSGLYSSLYILPDGKVTICEQLYWNHNFIVGDVNKQSIEEIWNSDKAKSLFFIKKQDIPSDSACHSCKVFDSCRSIRQVCYREVIRKHGSDKWYYPDPSCPFS